MSRGITRRGFLQGTGLALATVATPLGWELLGLSPAQAAAGAFKPHAFLEIAADETVTIWLGQSELGQGIHTGIAMLLADEIGADWNKIQVKMALAAEPFKDPFFHMQLTAGSSSIRHRWELLRQVGAAAREMLTAAAAQQWKVEAIACRAEGGKVTGPGGRSISFGRLAAKAAKLPVPQNPTPKPASDYKIIGSQRQRLDIPAKVAGTAVFGLDVKVPGMCIAVVARPPAYGATPLEYNSAAAQAVKGVIAVVPLPGRVAVCAQDTFAALRGARRWPSSGRPAATPISPARAWSTGIKMSWPSPGSWPRTWATPRPPWLERPNGEALYKLPYLAHAPLEPMNCTAQVEKNRCRVWAPTQGQTAVQMTAAQSAG